MRRTSTFARITGVDDDSVTEAQYVGSLLFFLLAVYVCYVAYTGHEARKHPPHYTRLVEYEFPMYFPTVRLFVTNNVDFDVSPLSIPHPICTFRNESIPVNKFCCAQEEIITTEEPEFEEEEENETELPTKTPTFFRNSRIQSRRKLNEHTTTQTPIPCIEPVEPLECLGEMLIISDLIMLSEADTLSCDFLATESGIAQIEFCVNGCNDMLSGDGTHWIQDNRLYWLQFSLEKHTYLDSKKDDKTRIDVSQMFLDPDFDDYESRIQFQFKAKSDSFLLVSEEDPVHFSQQLASVMACSSFLYMLFNICFALPFRKRFRCKISDEVIDYRSLAHVTSPTVLSRVSQTEWGGIDPGDHAYAKLEPIDME